MYVHKFEINNAFHHDYSIGLWSGGNSIDRRLNLTLFVDGVSFDGQNEIKHNPLIFDIGWHNTRIGEALYDEDASLLSNSIIKTRDVLFFQIKKDVIRERIISGIRYLEENRSIFYSTVSAVALCLLVLIVYNNKSESKKPESKNPEPSTD